TSIVERHTTPRLRLQPDRFGAQRFSPFHPPLSRIATALVEIPATVAICDRDSRPYLPQSYRRSGLRPRLFLRFGEVMVGVRVMRPPYASPARRNSATIPIAAWSGTTPFPPHRNWCARYSSTTAV